jgi:hypothetical protein
LIKHVETWLRAIKLPKVVYNTARDHAALIALFQAHEYRVTHVASDMVQLTKLLK